MKALIKARKYMQRTLGAASKMVKHHIIPEAVLRKLKINANNVYNQVQAHGNIIWEIPEDEHILGVHGAVRVPGVSQGGGQWNTAWANEIEAAGGYNAMTAEKIYEIRDKLVGWFDLGQYRP